MLRALSIALALSTLAPAFVSAATPRAARVVVALAAPRAERDAPAASATPDGLVSARLATRFAALGLTPLGSLADGLEAAAQAAPRATRALRFGTLDLAALASDPFGCDPTRILLLAADDSLAAAAALEALADDPDVDWVEPDQPRDIAALGASFPNDPTFVDGRQWGLRNLGAAGPYGGVAGADVHALQAWATCVGANDLLLAVADTGIDPNHPDLAGVMPDGSPRLAYPFNATVDPTAGIVDSFGHGTLVSGVMAARTNNGAALGALGIAGVCGGDGGANAGCRIVPIKITEGLSGQAGSFDIARALLYATSVGARAVNLSFAGNSPSRIERLAMYQALVHGCVLVAASGNRGFSFGTQPQYPAAYAADGLGIQAGGSDETDARVAFSSYGPGLDFIAPAVDIWTTFMTYPSANGASYPGYVADAGTSFSAPFATGAVGLLAAARPELVDVDVQHILRESAHGGGAPGIDAQTGWGRLDLAAALAAVRPSLGVWHDEVAGVAGAVVATDTLRLGDVGPGAFGPARVFPGAEQLEVLAHVALPDSFLDSIRVWPRVGGTATVRGGFRLPYYVPWAEVAAQGARDFTLRGYLYRTTDTACGGCDAVVPYPVDQARFGFTVIGRVDRAPTLAFVAAPAGATFAPGDSLRVAWDATDPDEVSAIELWLDLAHAPSRRLVRLAGSARSAALEVPCAGPVGDQAHLRIIARDEHGPQFDSSERSFAFSIRGAECLPGARGLAVAPNPVRGATRIEGPAGANVAIFDLSGRRVRGARLDPRDGRWIWDGADDAGRRVAPGVYLVRLAGDAAHEQRKIVRLE